MRPYLHAAIRGAMFGLLVSLSVWPFVVALAVLWSPDCAAAALLSPVGVLAGAALDVAGVWWKAHRGAPP